LIFSTYNGLAAGAAFVLINDHDPMPLFYEFRSAHGDVVGWDYLQRGGTDWRVQVTRLEASKGRGDSGVATLMDLRKVDGKARKYVYIVADNRHAYIGFKTQTVFNKSPTQKTPIYR